MIRPVVNINGSSADDLINPRLQAMDHLMDAIEALSQAVPNGRDYLGNNTACIADREEHYDRIKAIKAIREAVYAEALAIKGQLTCPIPTPTAPSSSTLMAAPKSGPTYANPKQSGGITGLVATTTAYGTGIPRSGAGGASGCQKYDNRK